MFESTGGGISITRSPETLCLMVVKIRSNTAREYLVGTEKTLKNLVMVGFAIINHSFSDVRVHDTRGRSWRCPMHLSTREVGPNMAMRLLNSCEKTLTVVCFRSKILKGCVSFSLVTLLMCRRGMRPCSSKTFPQGSQAHYRRLFLTSRSRFSPDERVD